MNAYASKVTAAFVDGPASDYVPPYQTKGWLPALAAVKNPDGSVGLWVFDVGNISVDVARKHLVKLVGTYPAHYSNKPDRRYRWVMHNCFRYRLIWVDD